MGGSLYYLAPKCLYRVNTSVDECKILSPNRMELGCWRCGVCECGVLCMVSLVCSSLGTPFYRLRRGTRLHGVGARVGFNRDMSAGQLEASVLTWLDGPCYGVLGDDGACIP